MISDFKKAESNYVLSATDYYPFGMVARTYTSPKEYRYGFNGKELDRDEEGLGGGGSTYDYGFRIYNPALARFLSVDPLSSKYPYYTPYQFAGNKPIHCIDLDGLEEYIVTVWYRSGVYYGTSIRRVDKNMVSGKMEYQPFGPTGAYYVARELPSNINSADDLQKYTSKKENWTRLLRTSKKEPVANSYYSDELEAFDQSLQKLKNPSNTPNQTSVLYFGEADILFEYDSDIISPQAKQLLDNYAFFAAKLKGLKINLTGFASEEGTTDYNQELSKKRMEAVKNYLIAEIQKIDPNANVDDLFVNSTHEGETTQYGNDKTKNRRVKLNVYVPSKKYTRTKATNEI